MIQHLYQTHTLRVAPHVVFGDVHYPSGGQFGPRIQQDMQLVIVDTGEARITVDDDEIVLPAQHAVVLAPGRREFFRFAAAQPTRHRWVAVAPHVLPATLQARLLATPVCQPLSTRVNELVTLGLSIPHGDVVSADELLLHVALAALAAYVFDAASGRAANRMPAAVDRAQQWIDSQLAEPLDITTLAAVVGVTPQHLTRLFHRHLHTTPARYLWRRRTDRGVALLRETGLSIAEIAERVGFGSPFHFTRLVRQQYGVPPRQLRAHMWNASAGGGIALTSPSPGSHSPAQV